MADLLAVSALESGIFPAINPDAGADALLDVMVQADLQRAERGAPAVEKRSERGAAVEAAGDAGDGAVVAERDVIDEPARSGEDRSELLKKEIEALLAGSLEENGGSAAAEGGEAAGAEGSGREWDAEEAAAGATVTSEELAVLLPGAGSDDEVAEAAADAGAGRGLDDVNAWPAIESPVQPAVEAPAAAGRGVEAGSAAAELAREMAADSALHAPASRTANGQPTPAVATGAAADPLGVLDEDDARRLAEAEGELEKELAALVKQAPASAAPGEEAETKTAAAERASAPVRVAAAGQETAAVAAATEGTAGAAAMQIPVPVVILQPDEEEEEEPAKPGVLRRAWSMASEAALMAAQLIDLPFSWIRGLDKHIIGVAAVIFFLSGCLLMLLGWWLGAT
ncbi:MAG TPA: hypothetical protein VH253_00655 [Phycisphaerae bacterium]|nr:hypothetical protein [Phycisphaerae bacterium]